MLSAPEPTGHRCLQTRSRVCPEILTDAITSDVSCDLREVGSYLFYLVNLSPLALPWPSDELIEDGSWEAGDMMRSSFVHSANIKGVLTAPGWALF